MPGSVHMEPDDDVYKAQAAGVFMDDSDDDEDIVRMVEPLNQLGVDLLDAQTYVDSISSAPGTFVKVCGRGSIRNEARRLQKLNLTGLAAMDLRTDKPDGSPWDVCKRSDRELAGSMIAEHDPDFVIGAPPVHGLQPVEPMPEPSEDARGHCKETDGRSQDAP